MSTYESGQLPTDFDDLLPEFKRLVAKRRLTRIHLLNRVDAALPVDVERSDGFLTKTGLAQLYRWKVDSRRDIRWLVLENDKDTLGGMVASAYSLDISHDGDRFPKDDLVELFLAVRTDAQATDRPDQSGVTA